MRLRRMTLAGLGLATALVIGVAGCDNDTAGRSGSGGTGVGQEQSAKDALIAAGLKLNEETFKADMVMAEGMTVTALMDPAANKASMDLKMSLGDQSMDINVIVLDKDLYLTMSGIPGAPQGWMHIDSTNVAKDSPLGKLNIKDLAGYDAMRDAFVEVERDGKNGFKGTFNLTKSPNSDAQALSTLGEKATKVPFTAKVDDEGRLVEFVVQAQVVDSRLSEIKSTYYDFGSPVTIEKPADSAIIEAPETWRRAFAGR